MTSRAIIRDKFGRRIAPDGSPDIRKLFANKRTVPVAGAAAATNIAVEDADATDITTDAIILAVYRIDGTVGDYIDEASVTSAGNIQLATTDTTGFVLAVEYTEP